MLEIPTTLKVRCFCVSGEQVRASCELLPLVAQSVVSRYRSQIDLRYEALPSVVLVPESQGGVGVSRTPLSLHSFARRPGREVLSLMNSIRQLQIDSEVEKLSMNDLNRKFASYIETVSRFRL